MMPPRLTPMTSPTPSFRRSLEIATPAAPTPRTTTRTSFISLWTTRSALSSAGEHDDGRAVLVVVEDRDVEEVAQASFDLEATRRRDVL